MQSFTDIFIKRPVFATVLSLLLLLVGIRAYFALQLRLFPAIQTSVVSVNVAYPGANPQLMEGFVATPIEDAISGVEGIDYISSKSTQGYTQISVHFKLGYDINTGASDVSDKVHSVRWELPKDINDPVIEKQDPNATTVLYLAFTSKTLNAEQVSDYLARVIQPRLQSLPGVSNAEILGEKKYAMRIWLNPAQMAAHDITPNDVNQALTTNNLQSPTGRIEAKLQEFNVGAKTDLNTANEFNNLIVSKKNAALTKIKDLGRAELGAESYRYSVLMNGKNAIVIAINPKTNANPLDIAKEVRVELPKIKKDMPKGLSSFIIGDSTTYINESINEVQKTIFEAAIFVILVVFLFLGSWRTLLIPTVTIPLSLIGVCGLMLALGFSLNTLTFLAMVLAIGMVVDDAIVISENIHRHIALGKSAFDAAIVGAREIKFAIISMTLTLAAVYAPIGFMTGLTGALFREFAFTLASAVIISGFIALTLSPMMCSRFLTKDVLSGLFAQFTHNTTDHIMLGYRKLLKKVLKLRWLVVIFIIAILTSCYFLYAFLPQELAPKEDSGFLISFISAPPSANLKFTEKYSRQLLNIYNSIPEIDNTGIINGVPNGVNSAISFAVLKPWEQRKRNIGQIIKEMFPKMWAIPGVTAFPMNPSSLPGTGMGMPIQMVVQTMGSYQQLNVVMQKLKMLAYQNPMLMNIDTDLKMDSPQINVHIDRNKAGDLGIPIANIGNAINLALGEPTVSRFTLRGRSYDVIPQLAAPFRKKADDLNNINIRTAGGSLIPLSNVVTLKHEVLPQSLNHFQELRSATLQAAPVPGYTIGQAIQYLENAAANVVPKGMQIDFSGESRQFIEEQGKMLATFIFALIFIFLVLAAQFESFRDPFIVLFSVPLSTLGALLGLHLIGGSINIYSEIGLVTLVGLISKHGILMVEFANQLQEQGRNKLEAIIEAASIRLRPILMTTAAMILGALPLAFASGAGAVSRAQMGWVIVGGMTIGTIFTLFVVPTMYVLLAKKIQQKT